MKSEVRSLIWNQKLEPNFHSQNSDINHAILLISDVKKTELRYHLETCISQTRTRY
jgi:hypothetical protein